MALIIHLEALMFCKGRLIAILLVPPNNSMPKNAAAQLCGLVLFWEMLLIFRTAKLSSHPLHLHHLRVVSGEFPCLQLHHDKQGAPRRHHFHWEFWGVFPKQKNDESKTWRFSVVFGMQGWKGAMFRKEIWKKRRK